MLTYNFCYPHQQGVSWINHDHYGRSNNGNTILLNFFTPDSYCYGDDHCDNGNIGDTGNKNNDALNKCNNELNKIKDDLKKANDAMKKCQSDQSNQSDCDKVKNELKETKDELNKWKSAPNTCNDELNRTKEDLNRCKTDPNKCDKGDLDECQANLSQCKTDPNKCDKGDLDKCQAKLNQCSKDDVVEPDKGDNAGVIKSQRIAEKHTDDELCGTFANSYENEGLLNHHGFCTRDLVELFNPEMYDNAQIKAHIEDGTYSAANYVFAFSSNLANTDAAVSRMSCYKCEEKPGHFACQNNESKSICYSSEIWDELEANKKLLDDKVCPNLISESSEMPDTIVKQVSPLILVNESGQMIYRDGSNTQEKYSSLQPYLGSDGRMKDCAGGKGCQKFSEIMEEAAWYTDKEILLKASDNENQDAFFYSTNSI